jgi:two-component system sensor histidine kinase ChvG
MALLVLIMFGNLWLTLRRFRLVARDVEAGRSFSDSTQIPELASMAAEFDRMVGRLNDAAALLRRSAEDNAHAFKTPVAIIRQALEMVRRPIGPERASAAFDAIEASLTKLDGLIRSARRLDVATADLLETARHEVDLSALVEGFAAEHRLMQAGRADLLIADIAPGVAILGREELIETILENLVDNAVSFSPPLGRVFVSLSAADGLAMLTVADEGPGVDPDRLASVFERYYSERPTANGQDASEEGGHFGVGLWIVRQNASALGGRVAAANRAEGGFVVTITLPLARSSGRAKPIEPAERARAAE